MTTPQYPYVIARALKFSAKYLRTLLMTIRRPIEFAGMPLSIRQQQYLRAWEFCLTSGTITAAIVILARECSLRFTTTPNAIREPLWESIDPSRLHVYFGTVQALLVAGIWYLIFAKCLRRKLTLRTTTPLKRVWSETTYLVGGPVLYSSAIGASFIYLIITARIVLGDSSVAKRHLFGVSAASALQFATIGSVILVLLSAGIVASRYQIKLVRALWKTGWLVAYFSSYAANLVAMGIVANIDMFTTRVMEFQLTDTEKSTLMYLQIIAQSEAIYRWSTGKMAELPLLRQAAYQLPDRARQHPCYKVLSALPAFGDDFQGYTYRLVLWQDGGLIYATPMRPESAATRYSFVMVVPRSLSAEARTFLGQHHGLEATLHDREFWAGYGGDEEWDPCTALDVHPATNSVEIHLPKDAERIPELWYKNGAEAGNPDAMRRLGLAYYRGAGAPQDYVRAREWLEKAAEARDSKAMADLAETYIEGGGFPQDYVKARGWLEEAAAAGDAEGIAGLAYLYATGKGVNVDKLKAREMYQRAADAGSAGAMAALGGLYCNGDGGPRDYARCRELLEKSAALGDARGSSSLGTVYYNGWGVPKDYAQSRHWFEKAAQLGDAGSMNAVAYQYFMGLGVAKDYPNARSWYERAASANHVNSMISLADMLLRGQGGAKDEEGARRWFERAATAGDVTSMVYVADMLLRGQGGAKDEEGARRWFERAAAADDVNSMLHLADMLLRGQGGAKDGQEARQWYEKASAAGNSMAMRALGFLYSTGSSSIPRDDARGKAWYRRAAEAGDQESKRYINALHEAK